MRVEDMQLAMNQIKVDIKERLNGFFYETDHSFALDNYEFVTKTLNNNEIIKIYKQLGPFDFYSEGAKPHTEIEESSESKAYSDRFDKRKSGAMYRGEICS